MEETITKTKLDPSLMGAKVKKRIAFDVDGTLIKKTFSGDVPRYEIIQLLITFHSLGHTIIVWSGCGEDYARHWATKLGLEPYVRVMGKSKDFKPDLTFDDYEVDLGLVNITV